MKIYTMTATFGKLEHDTLTLQPGLNVIEAPNEWGKSTWCAFLTAMLYGMETRAKSTKTVLADKERYAPWSGSPMSGRIDLCWQDRDITIERSTKGRIPLGQFAAYETHTGLPVPELTAANCGQMLLGVEKSVFLRAGFIRLKDMPVTQDDTLRQRLNALVTTGDESGDGERLAAGLRDLKNRCRYNRTGLLPQAEAERNALEANLRELETLRIQQEKLEVRRGEVLEWTGKLENHRAHLQYQAAQVDEDRVAVARQQRHEAVSRLEEADARCRALPDREETERLCRTAEKLRERQLDLQMEERMLPPVPEAPEIPECYRTEDPVATAEADVKQKETLEKKIKTASGGRLLDVLLAVLAVAAAMMYRHRTIMMVGGIAVAVGALAILAVSIVQTGRLRRQLESLRNRYPAIAPENWVTEAEQYALLRREYETVRNRAEAAREGYARREADLEEEIAAFTNGMPLATSLAKWQEAAAFWAAYGDAQREAIRADGYWQTLKAMAKTAEAPQTPDELSYTEGETARLLSDAQSELTLLNSRLNQYQGRMSALSSREELEAALDTCSRRIRQLEDTYAALVIAQQTLTEASQNLQRRFAPRITGRARELMDAFTDGRYDRLQLGEDLELWAGAGEEDVLRDILWRSDGTADQLYLALRLAVAEALTEDAPLILDDALVRFDDRRLKAALDVLRKEAETKQVILFTCQGREKALCQQ